MAALSELKEPSLEIKREITKKLKSCDKPVNNLRDQFDNMSKNIKASFDLLLDCIQHASSTAIYDSTKESIFIEYLDANNPYGWAVRELLPTILVLVSALLWRR